MKYSPYQEAIFDFCENGEGNAVVLSSAGSGKTTTIVECMKRMMFTCPDSVFLAFNKSIADELKGRNVDAQTFHKLCYWPVLNYVGTKKVDKDKTYSLCKQHLSQKDNNIYVSFIKQLISLAKQHVYDVGGLIAHAERLVYQYGVELKAESASLERGIELAVEIFNKSQRSKMVDFDDLLYYAVTCDVRLPTFDFIFVDEAQDTNALQHQLIEKIMHDDSRMIAVGDPRQAIYGFRGADSAALTNLGKMFNCKEFPLTVCYRCPKKVVEFANQYAPGTEHFEHAIDGEVIHKTKPIEDTSIFKVGDMVLSRTNAPLVSLAYDMLSKGQRPRIMGKEIGDGLVALVNGRRATSLVDLNEKMSKWRQKEIEKLLKRADKEEPDISMIDDKFDCVRALSNALPEHANVGDLVDTINRLFAPGGKFVMLSTIHKAKGLEADNVYWIDHDRETPWAKQEWQREQERNLCYVAATRAIKKLTLIKV